MNDDIPRWQINEIIFSKYYGEAKKRNLMWTLPDWMERNYPDASESMIEDLCETHPHRDAIQKFLAYEITFFVYRRLNGPWGEMVDFFMGERNKFANEYRTKTGYQLTGNNESDLY